MRPNASFEPDRSPYRQAGPTPTQSSSSYYSGPFGWWFRLTVPPEPPASADFATRDRARRGRLGGALLFGLLALMILAVFIGLGDPATLVSSLVGVGAVIIAIVLNRSGFVNVAGLIMVALPALVIILSIVYAPNGQLDSLYLPLFDLLAISVVIAASLLTPFAVLIVMLALIGFTVSDILLQPHTATMDPLFQTSDGLLTLIARPVGFLLIVGIIGFLWARNTVRVHPARRPRRRTGRVGTPRTGSHTRTGRGRAPVAGGARTPCQRRLQCARPGHPQQSALADWQQSE